MLGVLCRFETREMDRRQFNGYLNSKYEPFPIAPILGEFSLRTERAYEIAVSRPPAVGQFERNSFALCLAS